MMKAFFTGESLPNIIQRVVNPVVNSRGLYLVCKQLTGKTKVEASTKFINISTLFKRPSRGNWNIYVTDPELAKVVYNKAGM